MNAEVEIRTAQNDDLKGMILIQEAILQKKVAPEWVNMVTKHLAKPDSVSLVAVSHHDVMGFLLGEVHHGFFGLEQSGWIGMFGVDPKMMGQGVGRSLAQGAFSRFKAMGVLDIYTAVRWDSGDLLAFFKEIGFTLSNFINLKTRLE